MTRYAPDKTVTIGGAQIGGGGTDVSTDVMSIEMSNAITNVAGTFKIKLDDRRHRYSNGMFLAINPFDQVIVEIDGTRVFKGRVESPVASHTKKEALTYEVEGRSDFGALVDAIDSKHVVNEDAHLILTEIKDLYNAKRLSHDPLVSTGSILPAADGHNLTFQWKRMSYQEMFIEVANQLGAPVALGGLNTYYDFWLSPTDALYFVPSGSLSSSVDLGFIPNIEQKEQKYTRDAYPVKNDVFVFCNMTGGRIPLGMQPGYAGVSLVDSWTDNNAADWAAGVNILDIVDYPLTWLIGSSSIRIDIPDGVGHNRAYWKAVFPFGGGKWPAQAPNNVLNAFNETSLTESTGQMAALTYYLWFANYPGPFDHYIEVVDTAGNRAQSGSVTIYNATDVPGGGITGGSGASGWQAVAFPFGPDANYALVGTSFDWSSVQEIRFVIAPKGTTDNLNLLTVLFDGFAIVKPLVVEAAQVGATTRRVHVEAKAGITDWATGKRFAQSVLENLQSPQQYYDIKNIGRSDIQAGYTFKANSKTLVARSIDYKYSKTEGWLIDLKGWEAT